MIDVFPQDHDHKVRELSQQAMSVLASKVGKHLAPQLKVVMGTWLVSQCDTYPTVSSAAIAAFEKIFKESKQAEVLIMCRKDIIQVIVIHWGHLTWHFVYFFYNCVTLYTGNLYAYFTFHLCTSIRKFVYCHLSSSPLSKSDVVISMTNLLTFPADLEVSCS